MRWTVTGVAIASLATVVVVVVEVQLARTGSNLPERTPHDLDGVVGRGAGVPLRMTWLGDSTAAGVGATSADRALPRLVATEVSDQLGRPIRLTSLAVSGDRVADVLDAQVANVPADSDLVVVDIGSNDVTHLTSSGSFRDRYEKVLSRLPATARVVLLGVPDMGSPPRLAQPLRAITGVRGGTLDAVVHDLAREHGFGYVDIAGRTGPAFRRSPGRLFAADRYHPNDAGYRLWARATVPVVVVAVRAP